MAGFSVVEFLTEQTVEVVPNNWIVGPNACWWPTITGPKFQKLVTNPDSEPDLRNRMGVLYIVKVIKTYKNYADAKRHLLDAEDTSCLETESDDQSKKSRKERKRKMQDEDFIDPCKILSYSQLFESDDRDEDSVSLLADQRKKRKALSDNNNLPSNTPKKQERRSQPVIIKTETDANSTFSTENMDLHTNLNIQNAVAENIENELNGNCISQKAVGSNVTNSGAGPGPGPSSSCENEVLCKILDEINNMKQEQSRFQEVILRKISKVEGDVSKVLRILGNKECSPPVSDMPSFPLTAFHEVQFVESWLTSADNAQILIQHFSSIGGACIKDTTRRILSRMFQGEICSMINWTGKNEKFPFGKAHMSKVIISSVRQCHPESTEKEIEDTIKTWFRFCKDRDGGREKRREKPINLQ